MNRLYKRYREPSPPWGKCLKELRLKKGITQGDIFRKTGLERSYVSRIEAGLIKDPTVRTVLKISHALGMSIDDFVRYCEKKSKDDS